MVLYKVLISVVEIRGFCPVYKVGDEMLLEGFYIVSGSSANICIHALAALMSLLSAFSHGASARDLGIGSGDDEGYLQCPDPGPPYTRGGTVVFRLKRLGAVV
ncbi:MAG: TIGR04076 family protein [Sulfolobales archaeon]